MDGLPPRYSCYLECSHSRESGIHAPTVALPLCTSPSGLELLGANESNLPLDSRFRGNDCLHKRGRKTNFPQMTSVPPPPDSVPLVCLATRLARSRARSRVKKPIALTTETPRDREKALSFQFPLPRCLCGEKFVSKSFHIFRRPCCSGQSALGLCVRGASKSKSGGRRALLWHAGAN